MSLPGITQAGTLVLVLEHAKAVHIWPNSDGSGYTVSIERRRHANAFHVVNGVDLDATLRRAVVGFIESDQ